jgi:transcriptional regulator with XRE-family HTH domain
MAAGSEDRDTRDAIPSHARGSVRWEIQTFLTTRRARISPEQAGLPHYGADRRRVPGLRRDEVALLAGISSQYYTKLERGNATGVSESVIEGIARALQLDEAERIHLVDLIRAAGATRTPRQTTPQRVRSTVQRVLDSMAGTPALVLNARLDIVTANELGYALFSPVYADPARPANNARFVFLDPHSTEFFRDWDKAANDTVALLRAEAGRNAYDRRLSDLIGELSTRSNEFRRRWAAHDVQIHSTGIKLIHHPAVGDLDLPYESFPLSHDMSQSLLTYTAEPGSPTQDALSLLASWAAGTTPPTNTNEHENI